MGGRLPAGRWALTGGRRCRVCAPVLGGCWTAGIWAGTQRGTDPGLGCCRSSVMSLWKLPQRLRGKLQEVTGSGRLRWEPRWKSNHRPPSHEHRRRRPCHAKVRTHLRSVGRAGSQRKPRVRGDIRAWGASGRRGGGGVCAKAKRGGVPEQGESAEGWGE